MAKKRHARFGHYLISCSSCGMPFWDDEVMVNPQGYIQCFKDFTKDIHPSLIPKLQRTKPIKLDRIQTRSVIWDEITEPPGLEQKTDDDWTPEETE